MLLNLSLAVASPSGTCDGLPDDDPYTVVEHADWLGPALARLTDRERQIIRMRFVDGASQEQIGRQLGVSKMQVSRLLVGILARLRDDVGIGDVAATA